MTKEDFISNAIRQGISVRAEAVQWCNRNPKDEYSEDDLIELWRDGRSGWNSLKNRIRTGEVRKNAIYAEDDYSENSLP